MFTLSPFTRCGVLSLTMYVLSVNFFSADTLDCKTRFAGKNEKKWSQGKKGTELVKEGENLDLIVDNKEKGWY